MKEDHLISVSMTLVGRIFPLKVTEEEATKLKNLEAELNDKIKSFQKQYPTRDLVDHVLMTMLSREFENMSNQSSQYFEVKDKISQILEVLS
jgi:cell division protein ZapA (FtsZ GTPase activity inhibitor)